MAPATQVHACRNVRFGMDQTHVKLLPKPAGVGPQFDFRGKRSFFRRNQKEMSMFCKTLFVSAALVFASSAAAAASQVVLNRANIISTIPSGSEAPLSLPPEVGVRTSGGVVNSFASKYKDGLYWPLQGNSVTGSGTQTGLVEAAAAFTPAVSASVTRITVGLTFAAGDGDTSDATIALYSDNNDSPGTELASSAVTVNQNYTWGTCCGTTTATIPSTSLKAGTQYWVVITPSSSTSFLVWNESTVDVVHNHTSAYKIGGKNWTVLSSIVYNAMKVH